MTGLDALGILLAGGHGGGLVPRGTRMFVFRQIFQVFLLLGTLVGVVVVVYMLQKAYKYRDREGRTDEDVDRPSLGELPRGGGGGRKLFLSFALSTIIVVSLIAWTYGTLLYVEQSPTDGTVEGGQFQVKVVGHQFYWEFVYPNGYSTGTSGVLRVPKDTEVKLVVTSDDVFHNFGVPGLRVKTDAIPGESTETWFVADQTGNYSAHCYELCGSGHSFMDATVVVMEQDEFQTWYQNTNASAES